MEIDIKIPTILRFDDYHQIDYFQNIIKKIIPEIKAWEISPDILGEKYTGCYYGLFYIGERPSIKEIKTMLDNI